jgi:hypothetical protein
LTFNHDRANLREQFAAVLGSLEHATTCGSPKFS